MSALETHVSERLATKAEARKLSFYYGDFRALKNITMPVHERKVTALIGPSGCGKSTFLRCFNRMHDLYPGNRYEGEIMLQPDNTNLLARDVDPIEVRMRIGMVFQKPNPSQVGVRERGLRPARARRVLAPAHRGEGGAGAAGRGAVGGSEEPAAPAGVQPRRPAAALCIARASPRTRNCCSSMNRPRRSTRSPASIEELMHDLKERVTILIVTHNMQQAARVSDFTAYMYLGDLIEFGVTDELFIKPKMKQTEDYITGRFG